MTHRTKHLRDFLKDDSVWEFENFKKDVTRASVLAYCDTRKPGWVEVCCRRSYNAWQKPCMHLHLRLTGRLVAYKLKMNYSLYCFNAYISNVTGGTDHRTLVSLLNKPLYNIPTRLQILMLRLLSYNLTVVYKPGEDLVQGKSSFWFGQERWFTEQLVIVKIGTDKG